LFDGGHFFLQTERAVFLSTFADELNAVCSRVLVQRYSGSHAGGGDDRVGSRPSEFG
jgi:hypothetical protein